MRAARWSFAEMVGGQSNAAQVVGEADAEMFEIRAVQHAAPLCFTQLDAAIDFVGRDREVPLEVDAELRQVLTRSILNRADPLQELIAFVLVDADSSPDVRGDSGRPAQCLRRDSLAEEDARDQLVQLG